MARLLFPNGSGAKKKKEKERKKGNLQTSVFALTDGEGSEKLVKVDN